eukprot:TRINITY_DN4712_c0_g2_i10.p1 TRINITY_DN4712_c0_g2~~TRINITY_DN4712_c0_g2_i10.p1  ORF type:complete len:115 (-),score=21.44 TRINITY_DN4712_c0_g2_i10:360-704(-)
MDTTTNEGTETQLTPDGVVDVAAVLADLRAVLPPSDAMSTTLKELHSTISKTGKAIDKNFKAGMSHSLSLPLSLSLSLSLSPTCRQRQLNLSLLPLYAGTLARYGCMVCSRGTF